MPSVTSPARQAGDRGRRELARRDRPCQGSRGSGTQKLHPYGSGESTVGSILAASRRGSVSAVARGAAVSLATALRSGCAPAGGVAVPPGRGGIVGGDGEWGDAVGAPGGGEARPGRRPRMTNDGREAVWPPAGLARERAAA